MKIATCQIHGLNTVVALPDDMGEGKCPAILMLHGAGTRGTLLPFLAIFTFCDKINMEDAGERGARLCRK